MNNINIIINGLSAIIKNNLIEIHFNNEASVEKIYFNKQNLLTNQKSFYLDWNGGKFKFIPTELKLIKLDEEEGHIAYYQNKNNILYIEYHIIIKNNLSGIYQYIYINNNTITNIDISELRIVYRFDPKLMNYIYNGNNSFKPILYKKLNLLPKIQDETWQLENGNFYSKYDFCNYIRNIDFYGVYGNGYGSWIINPSHEYFSGGPLKQDLLVHQDALMINYLTSSHFGTPNMNIPLNYNKLYGPWLIYFNYNNEIEQLFNDVKNQVLIEKKNYPYKWLIDEHYNNNRGNFNGYINNNKKAMIILSSSLDETFEKQTLGYLYYTTTNNKFNISNIIPNTYKLSIYPLDGNNPEFLYEDIININEGDNYYSKDIFLPDDTNLIWNIGKTNRKSDSFCYSDKYRNYIWQTLPYSNLDFYINNSNENIDWFYAQTHLGIWNIKFNDINNNNERILKISLAATSYSSISQSTIPKIKIKFNNIDLCILIYENDKSIYRGALNSGNFQFKIITIDKDYIKNGENIFSFELLSGAIMYDSISYHNKY